MFVAHSKKFHKIAYSLNLSQKRARGSRNRYLPFSKTSFLFHQRPFLNWPLQRQILKTTFINHSQPNKNDSTCGFQKHILGAVPSDNSLKFFYKQPSFPASLQTESQRRAMIARFSIQKGFFAEIVFAIKIGFI